MSILQLDQINYTYKHSRGSVLKEVTIDFETGRFYAIVGASGAGKSTLLSLLAGLEAPTSGVVRFNGVDISQAGYAKHRREHISLVFQNYNLIDYLTPLENLHLVERKATVDDLVRLGLSQEQATRNVLRLSGGQQQRVAIARALASKAPVILADEPTGNLDETTAEDVIKILRDAAESGKCVIVVTHSRRVAESADVQLRLTKRTLVPVR